MGRINTKWTSRGYKTFFLPMDQRGTSVKSFFDPMAKKLCSFWTSRPLEQETHGEARTVKVFHVLSFDPIDFDPKSDRAVHLPSSMEKKSLVHSGV